MTKISDAIPLVPDARLLKSGVIRYVSWKYKKFPHIALFGSTGSGKTYVLKILLGRISKEIPDSQLCICDYKGDTDFSFLDGNKRFYRFSNCADGLKESVELLQMRQNDVTSPRTFYALVFDEWSSFINSLDKKAADSAKQNLGLLLMLGRSFNIHIIISQQRMDASYFNSQRDNFSVVIGMGKLSKESADMMFSDYKDILIKNKEQGQGNLLIGGVLYEVLVPHVYDILKLNTVIKLALER